MKLLASLFFLFFIVGVFAASIEKPKRPFHVVKKPAGGKQFWKREIGGQQKKFWKRSAEEAKERRKRDDYYYYYYQYE